MQTMFFCLFTLIIGAIRGIALLHWIIFFQKFVRILNLLFLDYFFCKFYYICIYQLEV